MICFLVWIFANRGSGGAEWTGTEVGPDSELGKLIAQDSELLLFALYDDNDRCSYAYTIPKERLAEILSLRLNPDDESCCVDLHLIAKNCKDYFMQKCPMSGEPDDFKLVSLDFSSMERETNKLWYARACFGKRGARGVELPTGGSISAGVFALLNGEVLKPRRTEYTRYLDRDRERWTEAFPSGK